MVCRYIRDGSLFTDNAPPGSSSDRTLLSGDDRNTAETRHRKRLAGELADGDRWGANSGVTTKVSPKRSSPVSRTQGATISKEPLAWVVDDDQTRPGTGTAASFQAQPEQEFFGGNRNCGALTGMLPPFETGKQSHQPRCGLDAELGAQQHPVAFELPERTGLVPLG